MRRHIIAVHDSLPYSPTSPVDVREQESPTDPAFYTEEEMPDASQLLLKTDTSGVTECELSVQREEGESRDSSNFLFSMKDEASTSAFSACSCSSCNQSNSSWTATSESAACSCTSCDYSNSSWATTSTNNSCCSASTSYVSSNSSILPPVIKNLRTISPSCASGDSVTSEDSESLLSVHVLVEGNEGGTEGGVSTQYKKNQVSEYRYLSHTVRRENISPHEGTRAVDLRDREDEKGEAECRTPSPARNGFVYDPEDEQMDFSRYEKREVDFYFRREKTVAKKRRAQEMEGDCSTSVAPDSSYLQ